MLSDIPRKSDAIILLSGDDFDAKWKTAQRLIENGYATHLITPYASRIASNFNTDSISVVVTYGRTHKLSTSEEHRFTLNELRDWRSYYELTHTGVLAAMKMMERDGFSSAIFISHPYHMRRVKMIAGKVFESTDYRLFFFPSRDGYFKENRWWLNLEDLLWVASEYVKIGWFLLYSNLPHF